MQLFARCSQLGSHRSNFPVEAIQSCGTGVSKPAVCFGLILEGLIKFFIGIKAEQCLQESY